MRRGACLALALLLLASGPSMAEISHEEAVDRLQSVQKKIQKLRKKLRNSRHKADTLQAELAEVESRIGQLGQRLKRTEKQLGTQRKQLKTLRSRESELQAELEQQHDALSLQLLTAYRVGRQEKLKLLLNQQDPSSVGRTLVYYQYFNEARSRNISNVAATLTALNDTKQQISQKTQSLSELSHTLREEKTKWVQNRNRRQVVLASLNKEINATGGSISSLQKNERELQQLIESLQDVLADIPQGIGQKAAFSKLKGTLPWPITGTLQSRFGQQRPNGGPKWQGVFIESKEGKNVRAISHGRIAFADWMRGYGLLVIIDHGHGYMSLYGHNQSLYKATGEWVQPGEVIAEVGDSGGQQTSGLYFEIRYKGKPINPRKWCSRDSARISLNTREIP